MLNARLTRDYRYSEHNLRIGQFVGSMFDIRQYQRASLTHHFVKELGTNNNNNHHYNLPVNLSDAARTRVEEAPTKSSSTVVVVMVTVNSLLMLSVTGLPGNNTNFQQLQRYVTMQTRKVLMLL